MKKSSIILAFIFACFVMLFTFCGCSRNVVNCADELVLNSYYKELDNGNNISLSFNGDEATLKLELIDGSSQKISGFCELSNSDFIIYDKETLMPYAFSYVVHFDGVDIVYDSNTVSLYKV
ncbi:MAG: hypothetical protein IJD68_01540 [Ruminococcus sp.]|nr:hypothetical protein [Ruminococcus sp.]